MTQSALDDKTFHLLHHIHFVLAKLLKNQKKDIKILIIFQWQVMGIHEVSNNKHTVLFQYLKH